MTVLVRHKYGRFLRFLRQEQAQLHFGIWIIALLTIPYIELLER
jgi:hypothetical protein